jgi:CRP-like cAMP-binding protein
MKALISNSGIKQDAAIIQPLISVLNHFHPLEDKVIQYFNKNVSPVSVKRGDMLLEAGDRCNHIYFIKQGVLRGFMYEGKKEITTWLSSENELVTSIFSFGFELPAIENIEAIENCDLLSIPNEAVDTVYKKYPGFNITGRKLLEEYYRDAEKRAFIARLSSAETKYTFFLENYSHLSNRVQLGYIASFLGITLETLSRVRKRLSTSS